jgi:hypothetical protein
MSTKMLILCILHIIVGEKLEEGHTILGKRSLILSIIGFFGAFLVPILGTIDTRYWNNLISSEGNLVFFIIFFILSFVGLILGLMIYIKEKDKYGLYALIIGLLGFLINGFWTIIGIMFMISSP